MPSVCRLLITIKGERLERAQIKAEKKTQRTFCSSVFFVIGKTKVYIEKNYSDLIRHFIMELSHIITTPMSIIKREITGARESFGRTHAAKTVEIAL